MSQKPTYGELLQRVKALEEEKRSWLTDLATEANGLLSDEMDLQMKHSHLLGESDGLGAIINAEELQAIMDDFSKSTGMVTAILDKNGNIIETSGWQDICTKFHRVHPKTAQNCTESDLYLAEHLKPGEYIDYQCKNGLWDVVTPLYIGGEHMGNIYTGQFFYDDDLVDEKRFIQQAEEYGFDKDAYLDAFRRVPKYSREVICHLMQFLVKFTSYISSISYAKIKLEKEVCDRKRAEQSLLNTTRKLQSITDSSQDAIILIDSQGEILFWNPAAKKIFGYTCQEAIGQNLHQLLMPQLYNKDHNNAFLISPQTEQGKAINKTIELEAIRKDGEEIAIELSLSAILSKDGWNAVGIVRDITDRKKTNEMLIQSEKMLSVGGLAAGMAHEINNPLAGMMQSASVIKSRLQSMGIPANLEAAEELGISMENITAFMEKRNIFRMIDAIQESGARVAEIVNSMLSFARKSNAEYSSHYPDQLMDRILELAATDYDLKKQYDFKSIEIIKEYDDNLPMLICDGAKIQQVLLNILRNGAQAMQMAKTKSPKFVLRLFSKGEPKKLHIEIEDNGPGMDEQTRLKAFEPFFTTKSVGVGTGLGLSVSYFIITENHKGTMGVISEPGKGANFIIRLPVDRKNQDI
ncbi:PocR ligand-binding domain-containing protein [uncultured Desulfobacter sp.]|uniref:PocR ligand-binding domain-containing protein n=1 Tax=uncultured Desulfobacter sp. TaxID=240139 RepID=UPI0029F57875|nr:PocR ligand-binding domain-containing protein [uncultured Desulfobacter sp.]